MRAYLVALLAIAALPSTARADEVRLPFELHRGQVLIQAQIADSEPLTFAIDTGAVRSLIDIETAESIGVWVYRNRPGRVRGSGAGSTAAFAAYIRRLRIADQEFALEDARALDLELTAAGLGRALHGVLGLDLMRDRVIRIDYPARRLSIADSRSTFPPESTRAITVPLKSDPGEEMPIAEGFELDGEVLRVGIDTGSDVLLELFPSATRRLGLEDRRAGATRGTSTGMGGRSGNRIARLRRAGFTPLSINDPAVVFSYRVNEAGRDGLVGNAYLSHFVVTLDLQAMTLTIDPGAAE